MCLIHGIHVQCAGVSITVYGYGYMGVSNNFPKLGRDHYGMDRLGLGSGRVQTQDPGGNRRFCVVGRPVYAKEPV